MTPRRFRPDDGAASEVVGALLSLGIIALLVGVTVVQLGGAQQTARERLAAQEAEAVAASVAAAAAETGHLVEQAGTGTDIARPVDLPDDLAGQSYRVALTDNPATITVTVPDSGLTVTAPLQRLDLSPTLTLCASNLPGGPLRVAHAANDCLRLEPL
ncbi:MAG: DUF7266 family protein [Thermoplasmatota archaeon]